MRLSRQRKYYLLKLKRFKGKPQWLAGGVAVGTLIGLTPTMPFHTLLVIVLCFITRTSVAVAIAISWVVCNPITYLPIYYASAIIGNKITPYTLHLDQVQRVLEQLTSDQSIKESWTMILEAGYEAIIVMLAGGLCFALPFAILAYYLSLSLVNNVRKNS